VLLEKIPQIGSRCPKKDKNDGKARDKKKRMNYALLTHEVRRMFGLRSVKERPVI
jgi:hypothetical protein